MPRPFLIIMTICLISWLTAGAQDYRETTTPFYSESLRVTYSPSILSVKKPAVNDRALAQHFQALSQTDYRPLLRSLNQSRKLFLLNDWLYYQLMSKVLDQLYADKSPLEKELARHVTGIAKGGGGIEWSFGRKQGLSL